MRRSSLSQVVPNKVSLLWRYFWSHPVFLYRIRKTITRRWLLREALRFWPDYKWILELRAELIRQIREGWNE